MLLVWLCAAGGGKQGGWGDLFAPAYRKGVLIGCMLFVFQQFSGINAIVYFSSSVFKKVRLRDMGEWAPPVIAGQHVSFPPPTWASATCWLVCRFLFTAPLWPFDAPHGYHKQHMYATLSTAMLSCHPCACCHLQAGIASGALASAAVGATNVAGTLVATGLIEKAGRKQLLGQSYFGMAVTMLVMAAGFGLPALAPYSGTIALAGTLLYILSFAIGAGPVSGLIVPEINNAVVRGGWHQGP